MTESELFGLRLHRFDDAAAGILAYAVDGGDLTEDKAAPVWARFDAAKAEGRKLRLYAEMHAIPHVQGGVILDKLRRIRTLLSTMDRLAIVGDHGWLGIYEKLVDPVTRFDIRHFTSDQADEALAWLRS